MHSARAAIGFLVLLLCLVMAGCGGGDGDDRAEPGDEGPTVAAVAGASTSAEGEAEAVGAEATSFKKVEERDGGTFSFEYGWPAEVSAIPELAERLTQQRDQRLATERATWVRDVDDAPHGCTPCRSRGYDKAWAVVADLPRWLSLSAQIYGYTGGAHGGTTFDALVWDRETGAAIEPVAMFRSAEAVDAAVQDAFCDQLDKARARKRGKPVVRSTDIFSDCIAPVANSTVILGSASGQRFDRVGFLIPPYNAGAYAEGTYEVTLDMTPALLDAVRPEYRRAFQVP